MKIMIYTPLSPTHPKIETQTLQSILALDWDEPVDIVLGREDMDRRLPESEAFQNITGKYNRARGLMLAGNYDAMLTVEADMVIPAMTLRRLTQVDADVAYGLYCARRKGRKWLIFNRVTEHPFKCDYMASTIEERDEIWGHVVDSVGMGLGCTLIHRRVLERIPFRCPNPVVCNDWYLSVDCQKEGFTQAHDCGIVCGHIDGDRVYWPDRDNGYWVEG
jgi:hypothetical protein